MAGQQSSAGPVTALRRPARPPSTGPDVPRRSAATCCGPGCIYRPAARKTVAQDRRL